MKPAAQHRAEIAWLREHAPDTQPIRELIAAKETAILRGLSPDEARVFAEAEDAQRCECGAVGRHPYPIGGGWAFACDECKRTMLACDEAGHEDFDRWARQVYGVRWPYETRDAWVKP